MAEVSITLKGAEKLNRDIDRLKKFLKQPKLFYKNASTLMKKDVLQHFADEKGDENVRWKKSIRAKDVNGKTLQDKGFLKQSVQKFFSSSGAATGTNKDYAPQHNLGLNGMPTRRFLWLSNRAGEKIRNIMLSQMAGAMR